MSLIKELNCRDDLLRERDKILLSTAGAKGDNSAGGESTRGKLSLAEIFNETDLENWRKSHEKELATLKDWLSKQPHLPRRVSDRQLLAILHSCHDSIERAKSKIDSYFTIRTYAPEIFLNRSITSKHMCLAQKVTRISPLRFATPEGYNVIFVDSVDPDVNNFNFTEAIKLAGLSIDVLVHCFPQEKGNVLVFDMKNSAVAHVIKTNLVTLKKAMLYVQKALPFVLKQVHVINALPFIQQIQMLIKPFVDDNLSKMIYIHMKDDMNSFYNFIPKKSLPKDYGGEAESLHDLNERLNQLILAHEPVLGNLEGLIVDESKRTTKLPLSNDLFGLQGSFKKLELD